MDMSFEALMGFGMVAIAIAIGALVLTIAMLGLTFKWAIIVAGNNNPSFLSACAWIVGISATTQAIQYTGGQLGGPGGVLLASLFAIFVSLYMISTVANCGLFRAFLVSLTHCGFMFLVIMVVMLPMAFVAKMYAPVGPDGKPDYTFGHELTNQFAEIEVMNEEMNRQMAELEKMKAELDPDFGATDLDSVNPVSLQDSRGQQSAGATKTPVANMSATPTAIPPVEGESEPGSRSDEDLLNRGFKPSGPSVNQGEPQTQPKPKAKRKLRPVPEGVTVNPFFQ